MDKNFHIIITIIALFCNVGLKELDHFFFQMEIRFLHVHSNILILSAKRSF